MSAPAGVRPYRLVITFEAPLDVTPDMVVEQATTVGLAAADALGQILGAPGQELRANVSVQVRGD